MAQRKFPFETGGWYHVYNRGCNKEYIFRDRENYAYLLRSMEIGAAKYKVKAVAFCLMPNHYHILLRQEEDGAIGSFMQNVFNRYVKAYNVWCGRSGTLFQGPFKAKLVDHEEYLMYPCRYIHLNPLKARLVRSPGDWEFSDYLVWIGQAKPGLSDPSIVRTDFGTPLDYMQFVLDFAASDEFAAKNQEYVLD